MWRYGLLRCKASPSSLIFKDPSVSVGIGLGLIKTSYLNPKIGLGLSLDLCVQNICTKNVGLGSFPSCIRSYSKSISEVLPNINLEVKHTDHDCNETDSEGPRAKVFQNDVQVIPKDGPKTIKTNEPDFLELSVNVDLVEGGLGLIEKKKDSNDQASSDLGLGVSLGLARDQASPKPKDTWFSTEDEGPVRRYENDQEQILFEAVDSTEFEKWDELQKKVLAAGDTINEHNIQVSIMEKCLAHKRIETGLSYLNYLSASTQEPNIVTIGKFCRLAALCASEVNDNIQSIITSSYDSLRTRYPVFDASTAESVIHGLSVTKRWKEGLEILDEIRLTCAPHKSSYSALIKASFNNDEPDIGWELLSKMVEDNKQPMDAVYESWLQYCRRSAAGDKTIGQRLVHKMLHFLSNNDIRLTETAAISFRLWFEYDSDADWNVEFTTVDSRGMCRSCHQHLKPLSVTREEFESLKAILIEKTIVGSNIFLKSSPEELEKYETFIKSTAPYDVVIDGLNVGYSARGAKTPYNYAKQLHSVVQHFVSRSEKVLVLGRRHMAGWPRRFMDYVHENAEVFLADNLSQDDPYLLYAAVYSGLGTRFISRDLMRGHAFVLDPRSQATFRRWQKQHQLQVLYAGEGEVRFRPPQRFDTNTQRGRTGCWHLPYSLDTDSLRNAALTAPRQWLCVSQDRPQRDGEDDSYKFTSNRREGRFEDRSHRDGDDSYKFTSNRREGRFEDRSHRDGDDSYKFTSNRREGRFDDRSHRDGDDSYKFMSNRREGRFEDRFQKSEELRDDSYKFTNNKQKTGMYANTDKRSRFVQTEDSFDSDDEIAAPQSRRREYGAESGRESRFGGRKAAVDRFSDDDDEVDTKQRASEERLKGEMLESESKQAFKSSRTRERPALREDH